MDKIYVNGMEFYGYHGVFPEETSLGQRFFVDVAVSVDLKKAGQTDDLEYTIDYGGIYQLCKEIVEGQPFKLVEAVAEKISSSVLSGFPLVNEVSVKLEKPNPPIPGHYKSVAVEITRSR